MVAPGHHVRAGNIPIHRLLKRPPSPSKNRRVSELGDEALGFHRLGIGTPYLIAAGKKSRETNRRLIDLLTASGVISPAIWNAFNQERKRSQAGYSDPNQRSRRRLRQAITGLYNTKPEFSASLTATNGQLAWIGAAVLAFLTVVTWLQIDLLAGILGLAIFLYMAVILFRGALLAAYDESIAKLARSQRLSATSEASELPVYSVMVALYKEAGVVAELINALAGMDWPVEKRDFKLVCEADDRETLEAIRATVLPPGFEIIEVPASDPRTKPKALNYALPLCRGAFLAVYDAEDRPSPGQLREAWQKFCSLDRSTAVLQAPLEIHNHSQNWLSWMFAIEYTTLFRGILPVLARWRAPIPLGGSSNHFRIDVLREVGAWDPHNVTEDADLGVRLFRFGFAADILTLPTFEEAPPRLRPWIAQRTRWLKGWMQTILVHSRQPRRFLGEVGLRNAFVFHMIVTSIVISAMIHPFFMIITTWNLMSPEFYTGTGIAALMAGGSVFNLVGGYTTYALLAHTVSRNSNHPPGLRFLFCLPVYWVLISLAGWRALYQLIVSPHLWEKTPHGLAKDTIAPT